ncbi:serine hydrolase domain-containing protein [Olivibacter domesticus]|uniref:CubicO group peptidase, beta-lactamase class C family n=1 Tax=Olivibacter domesticus TaxID=407022 RepID=A0A1H7MML2_OLID1|nr:serine hydrolase domain-containing protein [Olivibacter domesticus]SEL12374.1 CubicO group peptidase, beta-lactamase class C family [Olivibacter domesticus]
MFSINWKAALLVCFVLISIFSNTIAQQAQAEAAIKELMKQYSAIGLSVAVVKDSKIVYNHSFGLKDIEQQTPLENKDLFRIASISKSFSATSIMQLVEAKKLHLDDDFSDLVGFTVRNPKYPDDIITLKMVLSHTSSINDSEGYFSFDVINPSKNSEWAKCYNDYRPGAGYQYCNLNFNMVGAVIERASGERFDQYVANHILKPLNLYGSYCIDSLNKSLFATLYEYNDSSKVFTSSPSAYNSRSEEIKNYTLGYSTPIFSPTGGMKISAIDLAKYMTMHMNQGKYDGKRIIKKASAKQMQSVVWDDEKYGLALFTTNKFLSNKVLKGHDGIAYGLYSVMFFNPKEKFGLVLITNGCNPIFNDGFNQFLKMSAEILYKNFIE